MADLLYSTKFNFIHIALYAKHANRIFLHFYFNRYSSCTHTWRILMLLCKCIFILKFKFSFQISSLPVSIQRRSLTAPSHTNVQLQHHLYKYNIMVCCDYLSMMKWRKINPHVTTASTTTLTVTSQRRMALKKHRDIFKVNLFGWFCSMGAVDGCSRLDRGSWQGWVNHP